MNQNPEHQVISHAAEKFAGYCTLSLGQQQVDVYTPYGKVSFNPGEMPPVAEEKGADGTAPELGITETEALPGITE